MSLRPEVLQSLLQRATSEPFGLAITTNNPKGLQVNLCNTQRAMGSRDVLVCLPTTEGEVWLVQRSVELDEPPVIDETL